MAKKTSDDLFARLDTATKESDKAVEIFKQTKEKLKKQNVFLKNVTSDAQTELRRVETVQAQALHAMQRNQKRIDEIDTILGETDANNA
ncbi:hypothetical protein [Alkalicoccobacillus gibsonii]|uniref:hypothetical protein n=1 Tax=Alkalicoccobacillus gibsonii TaxID=79881 RepID=UPI00351587B5